MILSPPLDSYEVGRELGRMAQCFGARAPVKEIANRILTDCPCWISVNHEMQYLKWTVEYPNSVEYIDFEHFYWITQGINETLFDCWLADSDFVQDFVAHAEWASDLIKEMEILWELYWEYLYDEVSTGTNSNSTMDQAQELQIREHEIHELIEKEAVLIGL